MHGINRHQCTFLPAGGTARPILGRGVRHVEGEAPDDENDKHGTEADLVESGHGDWLSAWVRLSLR